MEKQDFLNTVTQIGTCEDDVQRRTLLATLQEEVTKDYDAHETAAQTAERLVKENETLREANMKLFLQVGSPKSEEDQKKDITGIEEKKKEKLSFNDLFDEKGGLK